MNDDLRSALSDLVEPLPPLAVLPPEVLARGRRRRLAKAAGSGMTAVLLVAAGLAVGLPASGRPAPAVLGGPATPTATPTATTVPTAGATPSTTVQLVLEPDGLGYVSGAASVRHLAFADADAAAVDDLLTRALGPGTRTALPDCGPSVTVTVHGAFSLYAEGTRFVGWSLRGSTATRPHLATADGVGLGTTVAGLRQAYASLLVATGTVGPEWSVPGGLAGGLDGTSPTSRVVRIGAGSTCVAR